MPRDECYPTPDELKAQERKFRAGRMEEEAKLRGVYGSPEEREHERLRVNQEWDKIEQDKSQGSNDDQVWQNHLKRMTRMASSLSCPKKALRRAKHFEMAGLSTASSLFQKRAEMLASEGERPVSPEKDLLIDNLQKFNEFVVDVEKYTKRAIWEVWAQPSGKRVTKIPSGNIVPFEGGVVQQREQALSGRAPTGAAPVPEKKAGEAPKERRAPPLANGSKLRFKKGKNGKLSSGHFDKSLQQLVREVRGYLSAQKKSSKYVLVRDMTEDQRKMPDFRKYNSGIGQAETYAREYGDRGLGKKEGSPEDKKEKKFLLGMSLVMRDSAAEFVRLRDESTKK